MKIVLIVSCEHASRQIPDEYLHLFTDQQALIDSHSGWDLGTDTLYQAIYAKQIATHYRVGEWSRLLVDLNRSLKHKHVFSVFTKDLDKKEKVLILEKYYHPYREWISNHVHDYIMKKIPVLHLSLHSFTNELNGQFRNCDLGLLYDPRHPQEKKLCEELKNNINSVNQKIKIRLNYPYRGTSDGFTSSLRKKISKEYYQGIEIEMNQTHFDLMGNCITSLVDDIVLGIEKSILIW